MLIFSPKARQLIDLAVSTFVDPRRAAVWKSWAKINPKMRLSGEPWDDGGPPLPNDVVETALLALDQMEGSIQHEKENKGLSEDDISYLDNDLSHIHAVQQFLIRGQSIWQQKIRAVRRP